MPFALRKIIDLGFWVDSLFGKYICSWFIWNIKAKILLYDDKDYSPYTLIL